MASIKGWMVDNVMSKLFPGMLQEGNIDLTNRPIVRNPDGSISTVRSKSFGFGNTEVLLPSVSDTGENLTDQQMIKAYQATKRHLGIFSDPGSATQYAQSLHEMQSRMYGDRR